ncbi:TPA: ABC transporter ATP-binding protein, partial [Staphylococcus aureus]|nr:ABC transporter ATP-binding protein [Staphylococcus aureus]
QHHINLNDIEIHKVSIIDTYFNNKKQRGSIYDPKLLEI